MRTMLVFANVFAIVIALGVSEGRSAIIYVDDTAPASGANDGSSWENAFIDLHDGLKAANAGDEVRVAMASLPRKRPSGGPLGGVCVGARASGV